MIEVGRATELLEQARELAKARKFREVTDLLGDLPVEMVAEEPELGILRSVALSFQFERRKAKKYLETIRPIILGSGDFLLFWRWRNTYAIQLTFVGPFALAEAILLECLVDAERENYLLGISQASTNLGIIAGIRGDIEHALMLHGRGLVAAQRIGDLYGVGAAHYNMGQTLREWEKYDSAATHYDHADEYFSRSATPEERIFTTSERARLLSCLGDHDLAYKLATRALEKAKLLGNPLLKGEAQFVVGIVLMETGQLEQARQSFRDAEIGIQKMPRTQLLAELFAARASLELQAENHEEARRCLHASLRHYSKLDATAYIERLRYRFRKLQ